jgi:hypothetical protein
MDSQIFRERLQGSKLIRLKSSLYHWKAPKMKMFKMGLHDPLGHVKHKLWPKEGPRVKLPIDFRSLKVENRPDSLMCRWRATYRWKALNEGYNFD